MTFAGDSSQFWHDHRESALAQARAVSGDRPIAIAGGAATNNQYVSLQAIDEL
jgi:dihydrofolate reductase